MSKPKSKRDQLLKLVSRKSGASMAMLEGKLDWQRHTIRAEISRLRKAGRVILCRPGEDGSVYQLYEGEAR